jgi:hypothetical protein
MSLSEDLFNVYNTSTIGSRYWRSVQSPFLPNLLSVVSFITMQLSLRSNTSTKSNSYLTVYKESV